MSSLWKHIRVKKGYGGVGDVTEEEKNATIEKAVTQWEKMGLTQDEMAFGIAVMNVESGFNPYVKGISKTEYGLGQFNDMTWGSAVKEYNDKYRDSSESKIYPDVNRDDPDAQIKAMGAWIGKVWEKALAIASDQELKNYSLLDVAYGLWHEGINKSIVGLKTYLDDVDKGGYKDKTAGIELYLNDTYKEAHDALDKKDILFGANGSYTSGIRKRFAQGGAGETLQRHGNEVWRIRPDGGTRGYFISE